MVEQVCESAVEVGHELANLEREHPQWRTTIANMLHAWNRGMSDMRESLKPARAPARSLTTLLAEPRFATATPLPPAPSLGRSVLLAAPRRRVRKPKPKPPA